jgi:hypothetical protein
MNSFFDSFLEARRGDLLDSGGKSCLIYGSGSPNPDQKVIFYWMRILYRS